ncbi:hypothetical protein GALMADRAFT_74321 [Galerina marginata CBS 339.88]|uniref:Uncharacterized protein n=1 Tax=Galerina marginata (strain CBS 339.88) TaxID=685588 RepID=A0A067SZ24_GALM3|nr:hypothetical protein GALMADRAFT_74321 [Galerina marginata CBS 339.88]
MSILTSSTINAVSSTRIRHTQSKSAPLTAKQKKERTAKRLDNQAAIDEAIDEWFSSTISKAHELAERFDKKPRELLDRFFHGGARMVHHHEKINPHNAFISLKAQELRDDGHTMSLVDIQREFKHEYNALRDEEREELIKEFKENVDNTKHIPRPSPRGRIQDFSNTVRNIIMLIDGLKTRVGVEGFFCLVRNTPTYHINPQWYFTSEALAGYMKIAAKKWNTHDVGTKVEAFAIAGCDAASKYCLLSPYHQEVIYVLCRRPFDYL